MVGRKVLVNMSKECIYEGGSAVGGMSINGRLSASRQDEGNNAVRSVFATPDLLLDILRPLIGGELLPTLCSLSTVSKSFRQVTLSDQFWREMCYQRWKGKWGFHLRWEKALAIYSNIVGQQQRQNIEECTNFWKSRYFSEERDATRNFIHANELESLVFDFRFWIGQPTVVDDGRIVVKSGLWESASREFRFSRPSHNGGDRPEEEDISVSTYSARGHIVGHPCAETGIECKYVL